MAKIVSPILARIEAISKPKASSYQQGQFFRSVLFVDVNEPDAEKAKIWKSLSESECQGLAKGSMVQLVPRGVSKEGVPQHNIILMDAQAPVTAPASTPAQTTTGWSPEQKRLLANRANQHADLLAYCLQISQQKFGEMMQSEESIRALATTIYLSTLRDSR